MSDKKLKIALLFLLISTNYSIANALQCRDLFSDSHISATKTTNAVNKSNDEIAQEIIIKQQELANSFAKEKGFASAADLVSKIRTDKNSSVQEALKILHSDEMQYTMIMPSQIRDRILTEGLQSLHTTGVSRGYSEIVGRAAVEAIHSNMTLSKYNSLPNGVKPKYGFLNSRINSTLKYRYFEHFGDDVITFKKSAVKDKTTFTLGDSLDTISGKQEYEITQRKFSKSGKWEEGHTYKPESLFETFMPLQNLDITALYTNITNGYFHIQPEGNYKDTKYYIQNSVLPDYNLETKYYSSRYIELQFWGDLNLSHVESFTFMRRPPSGAFLKALKHHGIIIYDARNKDHSNNRFDQDKVKIWDESTETGIYFEPTDGIYGGSIDGRWVNGSTTFHTTERIPGGSTGGRWVQDKNEVYWFQKKDVLHKELQTSAEVIASRIYAAFAYKTPETHKIKQGSKFYSISKDIGQQTISSDLSEPTIQNRELRILSAYLKDWDRIGNPENNRILPDGSLVLIDFGGTLGARARGEFKPGPVYSEAIGAFDKGEAKDIYKSYTVDLPKNHPWMNLKKIDFRNMSEKIVKYLPDSVLFDIVNAAQYSNPNDANYMFETLKARRNNLVAELKDLFD